MNEGIKKLKKKRLITFLYVIYISVIVLVIPVLIEFTSMVVIKLKGEKARPFLFGKKAVIRQEGTTGRLSYLDPHLGYAHDPGSLDDLGVVTGFALYEDQRIASEKPIIIVALGGSTTDPGDSYNWPKQLMEILSSKGKYVRVYNGGVSGYSTNQELLKLIRDVLPLKPDIIISLNGINDAGFFHSVLGHPMVHPYQTRMLKYILGERDSFLLPNTFYLLRKLMRNIRSEGGKGKKDDNNKLYRVDGINMGTKSESRPWEQWENNIRIMHSVSREFGIEYMAFIQPTLGIGDYELNEAERKMLKEAVETLGVRRNKTYIDFISDFYSNAREKCKSLGFCVDLTELFRGNPGLYRDARHPNSSGYRIIAQAIVDELVKREFIELDNRKGQ